MACLIDSEALFNCAVIPKGGVDKFVLLYNRTDWIAMEEAGSIIRGVDGAISAITNATGVKAFRFDIPNESLLTLGFPNRKNDGGVDGYDHTVNTSIVGTLQAQKNIVAAMQFENVVAIVMKKNGEGETYGDEQGLSIETNTANFNDPATGNTIPIQLKTSARVSAENKPPVSIFDTDAATTRALVLGLNVVGI